VSTVDYAAGLIGWPLFLLGLLLIAGGVFGLAWIFRYELGYDEPEIPPVIQPDPDRTAIISAVRPAPNYHRDDDTQVIPGIPGALPPGRVFNVPAGTVDRFIASLDQAAVATDAVTQAIPGLRVIPSAALWPEEPKSAPKESDETQVVDLCPLTTQDIEVPPAVPTPFFDAAVEYRSSRHETQDLTVRLDQIKERVA
jgi:hypothetical protein